MLPESGILLTSLPILRCSSHVCSQKTVSEEEERRDRTGSDGPDGGTGTCLGMNVHGLVRERMADARLEPAVYAPTSWSQAGVAVGNSVPPKRTHAKFSVSLAEPVP